MANNLHPSDEELRRKLREEMRKGSLPELPASVSLWAGRGSSLPCVACGEPIRPDQIEYEIACCDGSALLRLHLRCHTVWQFECGADVQHA